MNKMKVYINVDENNKIISCDTNKTDGLIEVDIDEDLFYSMKILNCYYKNNEVVLDENDYNNQQEATAKYSKIQEARIKLNDIIIRNVLNTIDDTDAYEVRYLYDPWERDTDYEVGDRRLNGDILYKCKQNHTSQAIYPPNLIPAIWDVISKEHKGTIDDPIPIPEPFSSMEYVKGKYYIEDDVIYLMNRDGMEDGESISLTYKPSQLIGHYFNVIE